MSIVNNPSYTPTNIPIIKAALEALIVTSADGTKRLPVDAVVDYARGVFLTATSGVMEAVVAVTIQPHIDGVRGEAAAASNVIRPDHWADRSDWPLNASEGLLEASLHSYTTAKAALDRAVQALSDHYRWLGDTTNPALAESVGIYLSEKEVLRRVPNATQRNIETRSYVITYVSDWDEESAPSPPSALIDVDQNDAVVVGRPAAPSGRNINRYRIYRTNSGTQDAAFQFVAEQPIATATYTDSVTGANLGEVCPTLTWAEPPAGLRGLVGMPNGIMAGFFGNTVAFCEPYVPYAWPVEYQITTEFPVVSLAVFGQTLVVGTRGVPYYISGADSASMSALKTEVQQACVAQKSMVAVDGGVVYASPDGLCMASQSGIRLLTEQHFSRRDWQALQPATVVAAYHDGTYYFITGTGGTAKAWALHLATGRLMTLDLAASAMYVDAVTDMLYVATGANIIAAFAASTLRTSRYKTGVIRVPAQLPFAWLVLVGEYTSPATVKLYGDGTLWHTVTLTSQTPVRLPPGRFLEYEIEVESAGRWSSVLIASHTDELKSVP